MNWLRAKGQAPNPYNPASKRYVDMMSSGLLPSFLASLQGKQGGAATLPAELSQFMDTWMQGGAQNSMQGMTSNLTKIADSQRQYTDWLRSELGAEGTDNAAARVKYESTPRDLGSLAALAFIDPQAQQQLYLQNAAGVLGPDLTPEFAKNMNPVFDRMTSAYDSGNLDNQWTSVLNMLGFGEPTGSRFIGGGQPGMGSTGIGSTGMQQASIGMGSTGMPQASTMIPGMPEEVGNTFNPNAQDTSALQGMMPQTGTPNDGSPEWVEFLKRLLGGIGQQQPTSYPQYGR